jgi:hypothetical protein
VNTDPSHHTGKCTFCRLKAQQQQQQQQLHALAPKPSSAATALGPAKSAKGALPIPPTGPIDGSFSTWGSCSPLLQEKSSVLAAAASVEHSHQHPTRGTRFGTPCPWGNKLGAQASHDVQEQGKKQGLSQVLDAALPAAAEGSAGSVSSHCSSSNALIGHAVGGNSSQPASPSRSSSLAIFTRNNTHDVGTIADVSSEGSTPSACIDADVVVLTNGKRSIELGGEPELIVARDSPAAKDQHMVVYLQSYINAAQSVQDELDADVDACCTCAHGKDVCDVASESESGDSFASSNIGDSWWALFKIVWPFLLAVQPAPMTTATILPLNLSSQVANVSGESLGLTSI